MGITTADRSLDVAASFPQASLVGVDLAFSAIEEETAPETCRFELDNVNLGLSHFWDQFDFVNARGLSPGVSTNLPWECALTVVGL